MNPLIVNPEINDTKMVEAGRRALAKRRYQASAKKLGNAERMIILKNNDSAHKALSQQIHLPEIPTLSNMRNPLLPSFPIIQPFGRNGKLLRNLTVTCVGAMMLAGLALAANKPAKPEDVAKMEAALPEKAPATPKKARKVLVYGNANGFVHSSIALGERTIAKMGEKTGAYASTISDDPAAFDDLSGYDAVMLVSCTGHFLLPKVDIGKAPDKTATDEEKAAYDAKKKEAEGAIAPYKEKEKQRFDKLLAFVKSGKGLAGIHASSDAYYDWVEWGLLIGGYFNGHPYHKVTVKIDDPKSPITAGFEGKSYPIDDETYTFKQAPWSRGKLHILTSLDVGALSPDEVKKENRPYDHDYGISWIHEYGQGRVFYCAHGHSEHVYWEKPMLQEYLAGLQYALGDLDADATPSIPASSPAK